MSDHSYPNPNLYLTSQQRIALVRHLERCAALSAKCRALGEHGVILSPEDERTVRKALLDAADALLISESWISQVAFPTTMMKHE